MLLPLNNAKHIAHEFDEGNGNDWRIDGLVARCRLYP